MVSDSLEPVNWCSYDALRLRAYGNARVSVQMQTQQTLSQSPYMHFYSEITLDSTWQTFHIPFDSLSINLKDTQWKEACKWVRYVNFVISDTSDIWLDDIVLE